MQVAVGHANPDFDAYAATVAATKLFPGAKGVFLGSQNANVRTFHNLHEEFLDFVDLRGLDLGTIDRVIMVDTRDPDRIGELAEVVRRPGVEVVIYDHHPAQEGDLAGADDRSREVGASTSLLVQEIKRRGIELTALEASVMLLGIHEDTGSLTYPGATPLDADAAAYLMANGADMEVLNQFLTRTLDPAQLDLLRQLSGSLEVWDINGQPVAVGVAVAPEYVDSASVLTHYVVEDMGHRVAIAVVSMPQRLQIVARSRIPQVDVGAVAARLGGGGHAQAASAGFRELGVEEALQRVRAALLATVRPPLRASDIMSTPVRSIAPEATMRAAGEVMARWGHGGLPVAEGGRILGLVTRKDVDKAARHGLGHAPVKGFMARDITTVAPDTDLGELERLLATRGIGRVPVVSAGEVLGIVTRKDVLRAEHGREYLDRRDPTAHPDATARFLGSVETLLPAEAREVLRALGALSEELGVRAHVVGGFVRDMLVGRANLDVDVVVEGDGIAYAEAAAAALGVRARVHRRFGTAVLAVSRDFHVDVVSSRTEYYTRPGALPTVERSSLRQDLFRRDFTVNAMAASLEPARFGAIADPFGGITDLETGVVRVLHALSFVEDPTRVLRAARFEARYGFSMDPDTEGLARSAVDMGMLDEVSGARLREELYGILTESAPGAALSRLAELGALSELTPQGARDASVIEAVFSAESALATLADAFSPRPRRLTTLLAAVALTGAGRASGEHWLNHLRIGREHAEAIRAALLRVPAAARALADRRGMRDSRLYRHLAELPAEALVALHARGDALTRERVERYARVLARRVPSVTGADLIALGAAPSPAFSDILSRARDDLLDGHVAGRDEELANLRRIALRAGVLPVAGRAADDRVEPRP